jgi:hypothetical protein
MSTELSNYDFLEAFQIGDRLFLTARRNVGRRRQILYLKQSFGTTDMPGITLLRENISVAPGSPPGGTFAFWEAAAPEPVPHVRIFAENRQAIVPRYSAPVRCRGVGYGSATPR